jgi:hypothetical protein
LIILGFLIFLLSLLGYWRLIRAFYEMRDLLRTQTELMQAHAARNGGAIAITGKVVDANAITAKLVETLERQNSAGMQGAR